MFKITDKDLKAGDLVRIWSYKDRPSLKNRDTNSELAVVTHWHRSALHKRGRWLFWNGKRGEFSCELYRVELVSRDLTSTQK